MDPSAGSRTCLCIELQTFKSESFGLRPKSGYYCFRSCAYSCHRLQKKNPRILAQIQSVCSVQDTGHQQPVENCPDGEITPGTPPQIREADKVVDIVKLQFTTSAMACVLMDLMDQILRLAGSCHGRSKTALRLDTLSCGRGSSLPLALVIYYRSALKSQVFDVLPSPPILNSLIFLFQEKKVVSSE